MCTHGTIARPLCKQIIRYSGQRVLVSQPHVTGPPACKRSDHVLLRCCAGALSMVQQKTALGWVQVPAARRPGARLQRCWRGHHPTRYRILRHRHVCSRTPRCLTLPLRSPCWRVLGRCRCGGCAAPPSLDPANLLCHHTISPLCQCN